MILPRIGSPDKQEIRLVGKPKVMPHLHPRRLIMIGIKPDGRAVMNDVDALRRNVQPFLKVSCRRVRNGDDALSRPHAALQSLQRPSFTTQLLAVLRIPPQPQIMEREHGAGSPRGVELKICPMIHVQLIPFPRCSPIPPTHGCPRRGTRFRDVPQILRKGSPAGRIQSQLMTRPAIDQ